MLLNKAYIGITGFMSPDEVRAVLDGLPETFDSGQRLIMFGVLASWKTLNGLEPSNPKRYPPIGAVKSIFQKHPLALNLVHYNSREPNLADQLVKLSEAAGENCHGLQLNMVWPSARELEKWRNKFPESRLVLQIGSMALNFVSYWAPTGNGSPIKISSALLIERLREYRNIATDILLDRSGGKGRSLTFLDIAENLKIFAAVLEEDLPFAVGWAGGLSAENLWMIESLLSSGFPDLLLNIDTESGVRTEDDDLDLEKAIAYLRAAAEYCKKSNPNGR